MKRIFSIFLAAAAALLATGCATGHAQYYEAVKAVEEAKANAQAAQATAIMNLAASGDAQSKGMALMWFAMQGQKGGGAGPAVMPPPADPVLEWARVLVPGLTNIYSIVENNRTARIASDNAVQTHGITFGTLETIAVTGMQEAGKVTIPPVYTVPMGSAPAAEAAPAAPAAAAPATPSGTTP
jgi:hypothetical protein